MLFKVTMKDGSPKWINPAAVIHVGVSNEAPTLTTVYFEGGVLITVRDKPEELVGQINHHLK